MSERPRHVVNIAAGVMERDFNLAAKMPPRRLISETPSSVPYGSRNPNCRRPRKSDKIGNTQFLAVAALSEQAGDGAEDASPSPETP